MKKNIFYALLSAALLSSSVCVAIPVIDSEKELYSLVKDNKAMKYDIRKKELSFRMDPADARNSAAFMAVLGTISGFCGVSAFKTAHLDVYPGQKRREGVCLLGGALFLYALAIDFLNNDIDIVLSPEGIKVIGSRNDECVKWSDVNHLKHLEEVNKSGRVEQNTLFLENITKTADFDRKETLFEIRESRMHVPFDTFAAIVQYYRATYGTPGTWVHTS
jgi:hypothetical protein